ncbi:MAG: metallophosphoesterase [Bacteroidales bacterium]|jgi:hypothetical protein|nr:metallophosphoesterase [Bacteroidales bacterium]
MLFYLILLIADLFLWFLLLRELRGEKGILRFVVLLVKASVSVLFIILFLRIVLYRGEFADPANAFRQIQMGTIAFLLVTASGLCIVVTLLGRFMAYFRKRKSRWISRLNLIIFLLAVFAVADGYFRQRLEIRFVREEVKVQGLDPALNGLKIALVSDLHLSSWHGSYERLDRAMQAVGDEKADLVLNTGDFITFGWQEFGRCDTILLKAAGEAGSFAVPGNHDDGSYYPGYDENYGILCRERLKSKIEASGYTLLIDSAVIINHRGADIAIAGVNTLGHRLDMNYGDFEKVLAPLPDSVLTVLLLHDPEGWLLSSVSGRLPHLTVGGHTHGLQIGLPGGIWSPSSLVHERWKGLYEFKGRHLYVTSGLGTMGMAARFFMPPEIVILTLTTY